MSGEVRLFNLFAHYLVTSFSSWTSKKKDLFESDSDENIDSYLILLVASLRVFWPRNMLDFYETFFS